MRLKLTVGLRGTAVRIRLKGIASATNVLADGSRRTYFYAWRGGPRLEGKPGEPAFIASYNAAVATRRQTKIGTLQKLIDIYLDSTEFKNDLSERTKTDYRGIIIRIKTRFGTMPLEA